MAGLNMLTFIKTHRTLLLLALLSAFLYGSFAHDLVRSDFPKLIMLYGALFFLAFGLIKTYGWNFWLLAGIGVVFRLIFIPAMPNLSQDFYRFLWDGRLVAQGVNPYLFTPEMYFGNASSAVDITIAQAEQLYIGMGELNGSHFSNYPPINQLCFTIAALFSGKSIIGSVMVLRFITIAADIGILYFGKKLLEKLKLPVQHIFWYFLNPFIIIELTGSLHFEAVMLFFLIWALYLLHNGKWIWAAVLFGISISVKLIPLLFLPVFYYYFVDKGIFGRGFWRLKKFFWVTIGVVLISFLPFYTSEFVSNFSKTISLWFQDFEFNASVFYIIRWIGFKTVGWNPIETAGKVLPLVVFAFVLGISFFRKNKTTQQLITAMLFAISFYFMLSTTVHPWYIATPLLLSVFTRYRFPVIWSAVIMLTYAAYGAEGFSENLWLVAIEYSIVIGYFLLEVFQKKSKLLVL